MNTLKKLSFFALLLSAFAFTSCTEESDLVLPDLQTTDNARAEGTGGTDVDPERD